MTQTPSTSTHTLDQSWKARIEDICQGIEFTDDQLTKAYFEFQTILDSEATCQGCNGQTCWLGTKGNIPVLDLQASSQPRKIWGKNERVLIPAFRYQACQKRLSVDIKEQTQRLLDSSMISERFLDRTFKNFEVKSSNTEAFVHCRKVADEFPKHRMTILIGQSGVGKTHLAVAILHELIQRGIQSTFIPVPNLLQEIQESYENPEKRKLIKKAIGSKFLILDDIGAEHTTPWAKSELYKIINARYEKNQPTVFTTNLNLEQLRVQLEFRTLRRIIDEGKVLVITGDRGKQK